MKIQGFSMTAMICILCSVCKLTLCLNARICSLQNIISHNAPNFTLNLNLDIDSLFNRTNTELKIYKTP